VFGLEVLTAVVKKSFVFWDTMPCRLLKATSILEEHLASIFRVKK
jgi:hypothetical protein